VWFTVGDYQMCDCYQGNSVAPSWRWIRATFGETLSVLLRLALATFVVFAVFVIIVCFLDVLCRRAWLGSDRIDLPLHYNNPVNPILFSLQETLRIMRTVWYEKLRKVLERLFVLPTS
jgi:hypothetical protein